MVGRNDMQRVQGLRVEEESRRKNEETEAGLRQADFDSAPRPSRLGSVLGKIQRAVHDGKR